MSFMVMFVEGGALLARYSREFEILRPGSERTIKVGAGRDIQVFDIVAER